MAKLWIVGNAPTSQVFEYQKKDNSITVTGGIPDIRDAFNGAHILIAPVFSGKGTRYKILEAMASKTPIVATNTAVEGLGVQYEKHVLTQDTSEGIAQEAIRLLTNPELRKTLSENGWQFVKDNYDWNEISQKLDTIYRSIGKKIS